VQEPLDDQTRQTHGAQDPPAVPSLEEIKGERDTRLAAERKGALWTMQQNAYLLKRYSRQGAVDESVAVNGGRVQWKDRTEEDSGQPSRRAPRAPSGYGEAVLDGLSEPAVRRTVEPCGEARRLTESGHAAASALVGGCRCPALQLDARLSFRYRALNESCFQGGRASVVLDNQNRVGHHHFRAFAKVLL